MSLEKILKNWQKNMKVKRKINKRKGKKNERKTREINRRKNKKGMQ